MNDPEFIAQVIITVMTDDPAKIIEAQDDAKMMMDMDASFGSTRAQLMAEYALVMFKAQNTVSFPELKTLTETDESNVEALIATHIERSGW